MDSKQKRTPYTPADDERLLRYVLRRIKAGTKTAATGVPFWQQFLVELNHECSGRPELEPLRERWTKRQPSGIESHFRRIVRERLHEPQFAFLSLAEVTQLMKHFKVRYDRSQYEVLSERYGVRFLYDKQRMFERTEPSGRRDPITIDDE